MITIRNIKGVETLIFAETLEQEALDQIKRLCDYVAYSDAKIRVMPDAHAGKGCTIGTTISIADRVTPNLVGVDIGCGMLTLKLKETKIDFDWLDSIIRQKIPSGFNTHNKPKANFDLSALRCREHVDLERANLSIGTLGGGNHFIEVGRGQSTDELFLVIHSGSRKLGSDVCQYYQNKAIKSINNPAKAKEKLIKKLKAEGRSKQIDRELKKIKVPTAERELAHLTGTDFDDYMNDMAIVQKYASLNRQTMANAIIKGMKITALSQFETIHNYIDFKRRILRKGAVSAEKGEILLIPINMRDGSLLCVGKGNEEWNYSAPHGAGRLMSRRKAKESIDMKAFIDSMRGIYTSSLSKGTLDEAPQAYKSIDEIKSAVADTVEIVDTVKPIFNFKA